MEWVNWTGPEVHLMILNLTHTITQYTHTLTDIDTHTVLNRSIIIA